MLRELVVEPGTPARLHDRPTSDRLGLGDKAQGVDRLAALAYELAALHDRLWAERTRSILVVLQGMDGSGKAGTIRRVFGALDPGGFRVEAFSRPTPVELAHDYLWRVHAVTPERGHITVFDRSHYEDLVTVRVLGLADDDTISRRIDHVREFERMLVDEGTVVVKLFLHISKEEQLERLRDRLADPATAWKFRPEDVDTRRRWRDHMDAYDDAVGRTSTPWAPWYVIPADRRWVRDVAVAEVVVTALRELDPHYPAADPAVADVIID